MMDVALPLLSNILIAGFLYALIAAGFSLIYSTSRILHLAQGAVVIFAAYLFYYCYSVWHLPVIVGVLISCTGAAALGTLINDQIYERMRKYGVVSMAGALIATISCLFILQNGMLALFGSGTKSFAALQGTVHEFGPVFLSDNQLRILIFVPLCLIFLAFAMARTRTGKAIRAVSENETVAEVVGISAYRIRRSSFVLGSVLAALGGVFFAIEYNLDPSMTVMVTVRMLFRAILGGVGSIGGAVLGSLVMETSVALTGYYWNVSWVDVSAFLLTFLVLIIRPSGLLGRKKRSL